MNNTQACLDKSHLQPIYNEVLGCIIMVIVLSVLILCKLPKKQLIQVYTNGRQNV
jgi:hypothetical protein